MCNPTPTSPTGFYCEEKEENKQSEEKENQSLEAGGTKPTAVQRSSTEKKAKRSRKGEEMVGRIKGRVKNPEGAWWWNDDIQTLVKRKKEEFKKWKTNDNLDAKDRYWRVKSEVKRAVRRTKEKATREIYENLGASEGEKQIYKLAKVRQKDMEDVGNIGITKDENGNILGDEKDVRRRKYDYFSRPTSEENERGVRRDR